MSGFLGETEARAIDKWHRMNGGHSYSGMAPHALRGLNEYVELCLAAGCTPTQIASRVVKELQRQVNKGNIGIPGGDSLAFVEEYGDVRICLELMRNYANIDERAAVNATILKVASREFAADQHGVLWRPGRAMEI